MKLPSLAGLRGLKQNAGRRLRAALVPELRDLAGELSGLVVVLKATREDQGDLRAEVSDLRAQLDRWKATADSLENSDNRLEMLEAEVCEHEQRLDDYENRLDSLEEYDLDTITATVEEVEDLPNEWSDLARRVQDLEELRGKLRRQLSELLA